MGQRHLILGAGLLVVATGCPAAEGPPRQLGIRLSIDSDQASRCTTGAQGTEPDAGPLTCRDFSQFCSGAFGLRVTDLDGSEVITPICTAFSAGDNSSDLCDVGTTAQVSLPDLPLRELWFEVTIWDEQLGLTPAGASSDTADAGLGPQCPPLQWDATGRPDVTPGSPQPAFARRELFDLATVDSIELRMSCENPDLLADASCLPVIVTTSIFDFDTMSPVALDTFKNLEANFAIPVQLEDNRWGLPEELEMVRNATVEGITPSFSTFPLGEQLAESSNACVVVRNKEEGLKGMATCTNLAGSGSLELDAYILAPELARAILALILDDGRIPLEGLVIGRIVDEQDNPVPNARVELQPSDVLLFYLNDDLTGLNDELTGTTKTETGARGYFLARNVRFPTEWQAHTVDGSMASKPGVFNTRGGELENRATLLKLVVAPTDQ